ncbi:hypothetical protein [Leptolyngbya sp. NIES-2104]|uniref:hypothetical protein n=1 Tax=Leptolyngbya sp. NIES-2104 TaxID=1552121 RepID=UPI0006EC6268|nr:hypothetical protein [Leptolyngbya sp. NIES-2104]GAP99225.1 hypothetical protein NIES2104_57860 [Leptolyngbya sp. NIES-2104]
MSTQSGRQPYDLRSDAELINEIDSSAEQLTSGSPEIYQTQETLYQFLLEIVREWLPEEVLLEFKRLFFYQIDSPSSEAVEAVHQLVLLNDETEFRNALKRCCYILINNWDAARQYKAIQDLVQSFQDSTIEAQAISPIIKRLKSWVENFKNSSDYEELRLFTARYEEQQKSKWISRYTSYLLVPQYVEIANPIEQREAARALSRQLKDRFKFDLAMYIARSQSASSPEKLPKNPTALGDNVLMLIKAIVAKRGQYSYANLANIFINQIQTLNYKEFKQSLQKYLIFSVDHNSDHAIALQSKLAEKLKSLYSDYDSVPLTDALILRTCNRIIETLTTENRQDPSPLFTVLLSQGNPMTLVIVLLKLVLICNASRSHLEAQIAVLIRHYEQFSEQDCGWVINFLEIFNVTFAIHAENVQYNLVKMQQAQEAAPQTNLDHYRIFSQMKPIIRPKPDSAC